MRLRPPTRSLCARTSTAGNAWCVLFMCLLVGGEQPAAQIVATPVPGDPVTIESGKLAGKVLPSGVHAYFGVPYAAAPTQELRWREPQRVASWRGVYNADRFAPECVQILRPHNINHYFGEEATSEDCLYLNIWAPPGASASSKAPVIVWLYGGALSIGSASMPNYSGEQLAKKGVVYVAVAYRVGLLGFMAHPELTTTSPHASSGNYGFLDQIAALQWIQRNISQFGGDPDRVTVMGQSAGAASAFSLQASPVSRGLFQRIVGLSGGGLRAGLDPQSQHEAERSGLELQRVLKLQSLAALRDAPADRIVAAQAEAQLGGTAGTVRFAPNLDAYFMPRSPRQVFADGDQIDVPLLIGFTRDESSNDLRIAKTLPELRAAADKYFGESANEFLRLYRADEGNVREVGATAAREGGMATSIRNWAVAHLREGRSPVYLYMYAHPHTFTEGARFADLNPQTAGAYHTSDVPFFLLTLDAYNRIRHTRAWTEYDRRLADEMSNLVVAFVTSGDPSTQMTHFPKFDLKRESMLELSDAIRVVAFDAERMQFMSRFNLPGAVAPSATRSPRD